MSQEPENIRVRLKDVQAGPIRHEKLTDEQVDRLRAVYAVVGAYDGSNSFEEFELGFLRDEVPEREIRIWEQIAFGMRDYLALHPEADPNLTLLQALRLTMSADALTIETAELATSMSKYDPDLKKGP